MAAMVALRKNATSLKKGTSRSCHPGRHWIVGVDRAGVAVLAIARRIAGEGCFTLAVGPLARLAGAGVSFALERPWQIVEIRVGRKSELRFGHCPYEAPELALSCCSSPKQVLGEGRAASIGMYADGELIAKLCHDFDGEVILSDLKSLIRTIPDYPKAGIMFRDVTTLLGDAQGFKAAIAQLAEPYRTQPIDAVAGIEARGFILGGAVADRLGCGFIPIRKKGKLPWKTIGQQYTLEYGVDVIEIHEDAIASGQRVFDRGRLNRHRRHGRGGRQACPALGRHDRRRGLYHRPAGSGRR